MNQAIRRWIEANQGAWRASPEKSMFGGVLGAEGSLPLNEETRRYFAQRGMETDGRVFEELLESDLLAVVERISSWMVEAERKRFDETVAFGIGSTVEPNACAMACLDGYAILFDDGFHALLVHSLELYYARSQKTVGPDEFPLLLNSAIATTFFHASNSLTYLASKPAVTDSQRQMTSRALWFVSLFLLGHEAGHVLLGHFDDAPTRGAVFRSHPGLATMEVLQPAHVEEFEADQYSSELLFEGDRRGELMKIGADPIQYWNAHYSILGWVFSIFGAVERMSERLGIELCDTHPSAAKRWEKIAQVLRRRSTILEPIIQFDEKLRAIALEAAESGPMPPVSKELLGAREGFVSLPSSIGQVTQGMKERVDGLPSRKVWEAWIDSPTPGAAMEVLTSYPELLDPKVEAMHYALAKAEPEEVNRRDILVNKLLVVRRSREIGIEATFIEYAARKLGVRSAPLPAYDQSESREPAVLAKVEEAVMRLVNADTAEESEAVIEGHLELQHRAADLLLAEFAAEQPNESARKRVEAARIILANSKRFTVFRAVLEARAKLRY